MGARDPHAIDNMPSPSHLHDFILKVRWQETSHHLLRTNTQNTLGSSHARACKPDYHPHRRLSYAYDSCVDTLPTSSLTFFNSSHVMHGIALNWGCSHQCPLVPSPLPKEGDNHCTICTCGLKQPGRLCFAPNDLLHPSPRPGPPSLPSYSPFHPPLRTTHLSGIS